MADGTEKKVDPTIGRRILQTRVWRKMDQQVLAELAGFSQAYLSMIENGIKPVEKKSTLHAFATVLEVAPSDLTGGTFLLAGASAENAALVPLRYALADLELGEEVDTPVSSWPEVQQRLAQLDALRPSGEYTTLAPMLPPLLRDLHAYAQPGGHRREALVGLVDCYLAAEFTAKNLGAPDLAQIAARHLREVTAQLSEAKWEGLAAYARANAISSSARERAYVVATKAADRIAGELDQTETAEVYGMLHLTAAHASTIMGKHEQAQDHLTEAEDTARRPGVGDINFGHLYFGTGNVGIWSTGFAVERGEGGRAAEIARHLDPAILPASPSRRAAWHIDIGRGLAMERRDEEAVMAFRIARKLAAQRGHADPWIREVVTAMYERAQREAIRRDLKGLAFWLGIGREAYN